MHKHHVTPKHRDPTSTLTVEVTVIQHAMFHYCEWRLHKNKYDYLAWKGLTGIIDKEELIREAQKIASAKALATRLKHGPYKSHQEAARRNQPLACQAALSEEAKAKRLATFKQNKHAQGHRNSQYGSMWITNEVESTKIKRGDPIPSGWRPGRRMP